MLDNNKNESIFTTDGFTENMLFQFEFSLFWFYLCRIFPWWRMQNELETNDKVFVTNE